MSDINQYGQLIALDRSVTEPLILETGAAEMIRRQLHDPDPPSGMRPTSEGVTLLVGRLSKNLDASLSLDVNGSHDNIMATTIGALMGIDFGDDNWPGFLEGFFIRREGSSLVGVWRRERIGLLSDDQC